MNKDRVVIWSGGCDSTLALHRELEICRDNEIGHLTVISVNHTAVSGTKTSKEIEARFTLLNKLKGRFPSVSINYHSISVNIDTNMNWKFQGVLQPFFWLSSILPFVKDDSLLVFGYISGDSVWNYRSQFLNIIENAVYMMGKCISVQFPFEHHSKSDIIKKLIDIELYDDTVSCESELTSKRCGKCAPCQSEDMAVYKLIMSSDKLDDMFTKSPRFKDMVGHISQRILSITGIPVENIISDEV